MPQWGVLDYNTKIIMKQIKWNLGLIVTILCCTIYSSCSKATTKQNNTVNPFIGKWIKESKSEDSEWFSLTLDSNDATNPGSCAEENCMDCFYMNFDKIISNENNRLVLLDTSSEVQASATYNPNDESIRFVINHKSAPTGEYGAVRIIDIDETFYPADKLTHIILRTDCNIYDKPGNGKKIGHLKRGDMVKIVSIDDKGVKVPNGIKGYLNNYEYIIFPIWAEPLLKPFNKKWVWSGKRDILSLEITPLKGRQVNVVQSRIGIPDENGYGGGMGWDIGYIGEISGNKIKLTKISRGNVEDFDTYENLTTPVTLTYIPSDWCGASPGDCILFEDNEYQIDLSDYYN